MHSEEEDSPLSKLINNVDCVLKFGMEIPDTMINDAIKQLGGYKVYKSKKNQSEKDNDQDITKEQNMSTVRRGWGKSYMCSSTGTLKVNVSSKPKSDVVPRRRRRTITFADNLVGFEEQAVLLAKSNEVNTEVDEAYAAKNGKKLKGVSTEDPAVQSRIELRKGKFEYFSNTSSDATTSSSLSSDNNDKEDAKDSDIDKSDDDYDNGDDDAAGFREDYTLHFNDQPENELMDLVSGPVFTDAQTTSVVANPEGN
ncbi:hypothetical protein Tco_0680664 [Tanacetum coccineum]|uniref:Uncharacterized protein n=1 Tax=Tanacetum coccineum TaxID=301880 RepID=A0ABQ4XMK7_9ASTR